MFARILRGCLGLILAAPLFAAGTCTTTGPTAIGAPQTQMALYSQPWIVTIVCVGDASTGSFPATVIPGTAVPSNLLFAGYQLQGYTLSQVQILPGATAPTNNFSVTITDPSGSDQLTGQATNLATAGSQIYGVSAAHTPVNGTLTLNITGNSVASANVTVSIYFAPSSYPGRHIAEKGTRWQVNNSGTIGSGVQGTVSRAAVSGVRHVADCVSFAVASSAAPTATQVQIFLRDGASGGGTVLWLQTLDILAAAGQNIAPFSVCGLSLLGSNNTAMTLEFSGLVTGALESVSLSGYDLE